MWSHSSSGLQSIHEIVFDDVLKVKLPPVISMLFTEKVTKYCDSLGNWIQTGSTCQPASRHTLTVFNYLQIGRRFLETAMACSAFRPSNFPVVDGCADRAAHGGNGGKRRHRGASPGKRKDMPWENEEKSTVQQDRWSVFCPYVGNLTRSVRVLNASVPQVCTAAVTGMAGYAGTTPRREPTPPKTAQSFSASLNNQVSKKTVASLMYRLRRILFLLVSISYWELLGVLKRSSK